MPKIDRQAIELLRSMTPEEQEQAFQVLSEDEQSQVLQQLQQRPKKEKELDTLTQNSPIAAGTHALISNIPLFNEIGSLIAAVGSTVTEGKQEGEDLLDAIGRNYQEATALQAKLADSAQKQNPLSTALGTGAGITATLGAAGSSRLAGYSIGLADTVSNSLAESAQQDADLSQTLDKLGNDMFNNLAMMGGLDAALSGVPIIYNKILSPLAKKAGKSSVKLMEKFTKLKDQVNKGKLSPAKAEAAAKELLDTKTLFPSIRNFERVVKKELGNLQGRLKTIYDDATNAVNKTKPVDLSPVPNKLRKIADASDEIADWSTADDLRQITKYLDEKTPKAMSIKKAWKTKQTLGKDARSATGQVITNDAKELARSEVKAQLDEALAQNLGPNHEIIQRLTDANRRASNLMTAVKPISKEAAKKASSLIPSAGEGLLFALGSIAPISSVVAGARYAARAGGVIIPGVAAKTLNRVSKLGRFGPLRRRLPGAGPILGSELVSESEE